MTAESTVSMTDEEKDQEIMRLAATMFGLSNPFQESAGGETDMSMTAESSDGALDTKLSETVITGETMSMTEYAERGYTEEYFELKAKLLGVSNQFQESADETKEIMLEGFNNTADKKWDDLHADLKHDSQLIRNTNELVFKNTTDKLLHDIKDNTELILQAVMVDYKKVKASEKNLKDAAKRETNVLNENIALKQIIADLRREVRVLKQRLASKKRCPKCESK